MKVTHLSNGKRRGEKGGIAKVYLLIFQSSIQQTQGGVHTSLAPFVFTTTCEVEKAEK